MLIRKCIRKEINSYLEEIVETDKSRDFPVYYQNLNGEKVKNVTKSYNRIHTIFFKSDLES